MLNQSQRNKRIEVALWKIKEAAWELHGKTLFQSEMTETVRSITLLVDKQLRRLGCNPKVLVRGGE